MQNPKFYCQQFYLTLNISVVGNANVNENERNQVVFDLIVDLEWKKQGRSIDKIIDCYTKKLGLDRLKR